MSISPNALSGWATLMGSFAKTLDVKAVSDGWFTPDAGFQRAQ